MKTLKQLTITSKKSAFVKCAELIAKSDKKNVITIHAGMSQKKQASLYKKMFEKK
jgi:hypothetical protein